MCDADEVIHHITHSSTVSSQKFTYTLQNKLLHQGSTKQKDNIYIFVFPLIAKITNILQILQGVCKTLKGKYLSLSFIWAKFNNGLDLFYKQMFSLFFFLKVFFPDFPASLEQIHSHLLWRAPGHWHKQDFPTTSKHLVTNDFGFLVFFFYGFLHFYFIFVF